MLISLHFEGYSRSGALGLPFLTQLLASGLTAAAQFLRRVTLDGMTLWDLFPLRAFGLAAARVLRPMRQAVFREARQLMSDRLGRNIIVMTEGVIAPIAALLTLRGILLARCPRP